MTGKKQLWQDGEKEFYTELGALIQMYRNQLGLSQKSVAKMLGISFQQIQKYESAANRIPVFILHKMSHLYGVSFANIIGQDLKNSDYRILHNAPIKKQLLDAIHCIDALAQTLQVGHIIDKEITKTSFANS